MQLDQPAHQRKSHAEPAGAAVERALALHEQIEDARQQRARNADAGVAHVEQRLVAIAPDADLDMPAGRRVLERVGQQIADDLVDARGIGVDPDRRRVQLELVLLHGAGDFERRRGALHQRREIQRMARQADLARDHARHVEQVFHHVREVARLPRDDAARAAGQFAVGIDATEHLDRGRDRRQRIAQLVTEHREELVLRAVRRLGLEPRVMLARDQRGTFELGALGLAHVDADADQLLRRAVDAIDEQHARRQPALAADTELEGLVLATIGQRAAQCRFDARAIVFVDALDPLAPRAFALRRRDAEQLGEAGRPRQPVAVETVVRRSRRGRLPRRDRSGAGFRAAVGRR